MNKLPDFILDCGFRQSTLLDTKTRNVTTISHSEVLQLPSTLPEGSFIVCEDAHLGCPRTEKSLAQVFSAEELLNLYKGFEDSNITLKLFPQKSTPRACNYSNLEKSDENDPLSILLLLEAFPEISLKNPPKTFKMSDLRLESYTWVDKSNHYLNICRRYKYMDMQDANYQFLIKNINVICESLSPESQSAFSFERYKSKAKKGEININKLKLAQIFSILIQLQDPDGNLRYRENTQELPGWKFVKRYVLKQTPFHFRGGVARSNLYYHGLKNWVASEAAKELGMTSKQFNKLRRGGYYTENGKVYVPPMTREQDNTYLKYRQLYCKAIKELFTVCKDLMGRGVHGVIPINSEFKFSSCDPSKTPIDKENVYA